MLSGGVAKYMELLLDAGAYTHENIIDAVCQPGSTFLTEGTELLMGEFGKRYQIYFSIMQLIANGLTTQSQIDTYSKRLSIMVIPKSEVQRIATRDRSG